MSWVLLIGAVIAFFVVLSITRKIIRALVTGLVILVVGGAIVLWLLNQGLITL
jgi:hypothetical protein